MRFREAESAGQPQERSAFSLVEVTMALGIVAFGVIVIFALLPTGLNLVRESSDEAVAINIATMIAADLQSVQPGMSATPRFGISFRDGQSGGVLAPGETSGLYFDENGARLGSSSGQSRSAAAAAGANFLASYRLRAGGANSPASAQVMVSWPVPANPPSGHVEFLVILPEEPAP